ncbi:MAG: hypothetical protein RL518_420 [Pseudomonadota bacterium]|jgi:hypothetical protein
MSNLNSGSYAPCMGNQRLFERVDRERLRRH